MLTSLPAKALGALVALAVLLPIVARVFRRTWQALDADALAYRQELAAARRLDVRAYYTFVAAAFALSLIEYLGDRDFFNRTVLPWLNELTARNPGLPNTGDYGELYWRTFWGSARVGSYLLPVLVWPLVFRGDSLLDLGLRGRGFVAHLPLYLLCLVVIIPTLAIASRTGEFSAKYPLYALARRSWVDFWIWEAIYVAQFFALEVFFRGLLLRGARGLGSAAIFAMVTPYAMIHFAKPLLETCGAIVAGTVLGSLAMRTRSIYAGFLVHGTVGLLMDLLALEQKGALPVKLAPESTRGFAFPHLQLVIWSLWAVALVTLLVWVRRRGWRQILLDA